MGLRTGAEYIKAVSQPREVYVNGRMVRDVTSCPEFQPGLEAIASLYDLKHEKQHRDHLSFFDAASQQRRDMTFLIPRTAEDLERLERAFRLYAKKTYGLMGRSPEFLNRVMVALYDNADWLGQFNPDWPENLRRYFQYIADRDLFLTHALINPQNDRSKPSHQQSDPYLHLRVKEETQDGLVVRGAKMLATLAPLADELLVYPLPGYVPGDEPYCLMFAIPMDSPGLKVVCREPLMRTAAPTFDHPLSRFEEIDALLIFDDVLIPWDRVFLYGNVQAANALYANSDMRNHAGFQTGVRAVVKAGLAVAVAQKLSASVKTDVFPQVGERLGLMISMLKASEGLVELAKAKAKPKSNGTLLPDFDDLQSLRVLFPRFYAQMVEYIQINGAGGLFLTPTEQEFRGQLAADLEKYLRGAAVGGESRVRIAKLAWDLVGEGVGQRAVAYERYYAGDPMFLAHYLAQVGDTREWQEMVDELLASQSQPVA
jgi:anthranilate 3-monooxygenase (FAD)/4-hydroxyphenylacetate 3-monooxygenase